MTIGGSVDIDSTEISWPLLIRHEGQPEMTRVNDLAEWNRLQDDHIWLTGPGDRLVDSTGRFWEVSQLDAGRLDITRGELIDSVELLDYVKHHLSAKGVCCISKFAQNDIASLFQMVGTLDDE